MNKKERANKQSLISSPYIIWVIGFTVLPLLVIFRYAFTDSNGNFTFKNVFATFDMIHMKAIIYSLGIALGCTVICVLLSYPLVMALRCLNLKKQKFTLFIFILPMWMNFILRVLAWQMILSNNGILNFVLTGIGLEPLRIANTGTALMIGVVYDYLPYMVLPIYNAISEIDEDIIEAAKDLGADGFTVFCKIIFPMSLPGLLSGIVMVFVPTMTSFVISDILGGGKVQLIGNVIEQEFTKAANWNLGSGLSVSLMIFVLISMAFTTKNDNEGKGTAIW
ncbi:MAG: ABC transporter permease [Ruminococcaceae bacterium]|nr:ABC transporter permease [Oscillospiraceae bacterium]